MFDRIRPSHVYCCNEVPDDEVSWKYAYGGEGIDVVRKADESAELQLKRHLNMLLSAPAARRLLQDGYSSSGATGISSQCSETRSYLPTTHAVHSEPLDSSCADLQTQRVRTLVSVCGD